MYFIKFLFLSMLLSLISCEKKPEQLYPVAKDYQRIEADWLTQEEAMLRSQSISNIKYFLQLDLTKSSRYSGFVEIKFDYQPIPFPLTIDFSGGEAVQIDVNNETIAINYSGNFISIPAEKLETGTNIIKVQFTHHYSDNGSGLYRYIDPADDNTYLYTYLEPYDGNKLFPSFDQPNLKATYRLKVVTNKEWTVVSSVRESDIIIDGPYKRWYFPESNIISANLFLLHAGPWHIWDGKAGRTPLRLMTRQSLAEKINVREWFRITQQGFKFFENYFSMSYPYSKYDQLIVPDINTGGMANNSAVIFSEQYILAGKASHAQKRKTANIILHELSHMWFGNLVSINWWDDLWLKESFATYMAPLALSQATLYKNAWKDFYINTKPDAYNVDQSVNTLPVYREVTHSKSADTNLDIISFNKGAAVLKQLSRYLGDNTFRKGIRDFLKKYKNRAAKTNDFLKIMEKSSGSNLQQWGKQWFNTAGVNSLTADYQCSNGKISKFSLKQSAPKEFPVLRKHLVQVALYDKIDGQIVTTTVEPVSIQGSDTTVQQFSGLPCPLMVNPNHGDWGYIKVELDRKTLLLLPDNIINVKDPLSRSMFWQNLWDRVLELKMPVNRYLQIVLDNINAENDIEIICQVLSNLSTANQWLNAARPTNKQAISIINNYEDVILGNVQLSADGSDEQKIWFQYLIKIVQTDAGLDYLSKWLQGKQQPDFLASDQKLRWNAIIRLCSLDHADCKPLIKLEQIYDQSEYGSIMLLAANASLPDFETKQYWLDEIFREEQRQTETNIKVVMQYLFPVEQSHLHKVFAQRIISDLNLLITNQKNILVKQMISTILPALCTEESVARLKELKKNMINPGLIAQKDVEIAYQDDALCVAINKRLNQQKGSNQ